MNLNSLLVLLSTVSLGLSAKILGIFHVPSKSHHISGEVIFKELVKRGHEVTMVSPYPLKEKVENYTDIFLEESFHEKIHHEKHFLESEGKSVVTTLPGFFNMTRGYSNLVFRNEEVKKLISSNEQFDLVVLDWFMSESHLVFGHIFNAPVIFSGSMGSTPMIKHMMGNVAPCSFVPSKGGIFSDTMTLFERVVNTMLFAISETIFYVNLRYHQNVLKELFPNAPTIEKLMKNVALVLSNSHYTYESPRPTVPNIIDVGGLHVQEPRPLRPDLQRFLDSSKQGVIYFSLGSNMKSTDLPQNIINEILLTFSRIPFKVLWKWEGDDIPNKSNNVILGKWFPQNDVLAHPNVKLFITHGGLFSTIEAIYHGVPLIGIPLFGDQRANVANIVNANIGMQLNLKEITQQSLLRSITELMSNPIYRENMKKRSTLLKDQPMKPLDTAVFWVEHIIRHKGADHLKTKGADIPLYQYLLLDVVGAVSLALLALSVISYFVLKRLLIIYRKVFRGKKQQDATIKTKKKV